MKSTAFTVLSLVLVALGSADYSEEEEHLLEALIESNLKGYDRPAAIELNNYIDSILKEVLEKVRSIVKNNEPYPVPDFPTQQIDDKNVHINLTLANVKENYLSEFVLNSLKNSVFEMTEAFDITFPRLQYFGNYAIYGTVMNRATVGEGNFNVTMEDLHTWGKAYAHIVDKSVQLKRLDIDYTLSNVTAIATGLTVQGLSQQQIQKFLSIELLQYFTDNEKIVSASISSVVIKEVNKLLQGMTVMDLIRWFKHFIHCP